MTWQPNSPNLWRLGRTPNMTTPDTNECGSGAGCLHKDARIEHLEAEVERLRAQVAPACQYCDGTGDVHTITGEWRGVCTCDAGKAIKAEYAAPAQQAEPHSWAPFIQHVQSVADGGSTWADEWLKWYSPGEWLTEEWAAATFLGGKLAPAPSLTVGDVPVLAMPDGWKLVEKRTHFQLNNLSNNTVVATLCGPDAEENAAIIARLLTTPPAAQAEPAADFEAWLRTVCFQKPTTEAYDLARSAWRAALAQPAVQAEPVARLLHWRGPSHYPVPHGGIAARTFAEFPRESADAPDSYWKSGAPLYTAPPSNPPAQGMGELPPLPEPDYADQTAFLQAFTADQMRAYARTALAQAQKEKP